MYEELVPTIQHTNKSTKMKYLFDSSKPQKTGVMITRLESVVNGGFLTRC